MVKNKWQIVNNTESGFTLVEMLVTAAIFALAFIAIAAIFVGVTNSQNRSKATAAVLNESQFVFEQITRKIKENTVVTDPAICNCDGSDQNFICLADLTGARTFFRFYNNEAQYASGVSNCQAASWLRLNDQSITINKLEFYTDLYDGISHYSRQPMTTIIMKASNNEANIKKQATVNFQTAVSSRLYLPAN